MHDCKELTEGIQKGSTSWVGFDFLRQFLRNGLGSWLAKVSGKSVVRRQIGNFELHVL